MLLIGIVGSIMASFLYVVTRTTDLAFITRRSRCLSCRNTLSARDLIPVVSYMMLGGKCRYCKVRIPATYVVVEVVLFLLFMLPLVFSMQMSDIALYYLLMSLLIPIAVYDFETYTIPNHMTLLILVTGLAITQLNYVSVIVDSIVVLLLHVIFFLFKNAIGYGDIKLFSVLAIVTPTNFLMYTFLLTFLIGGIFVITIFLYRKTSIKKVPLAPFIANAVIMTFVLYEDMNILYFGGFT